MPSKSQRLTLIVIVVLAVLLRVGVAFYLGDTTPLGKDETSYSTLAWRVAQGYGYSFPTGWYPFTPANTPTAHWSFLYTGFMAAIYAITGFHPLAARLAGAVLTGILFPLLLYRLSRRVFGSFPPTISRSPLTINHLTALLGAVYAYFILYSAMVQTEAFFICALLWSLERALVIEQALRAKQAPSWWSVIGFGVSLGVAALLRQSILPWVVVLGFYLLWVGYRHQRFGRALVVMCLTAVITLIFILPFTLRNAKVYGEFLLLNSNAGYALYSAQHPMHGTSFQEYTAAPLPAELMSLGLNEAQWDKALTARGIEFVLADPVRYLLLSLSRVRDYFEFWPTADSSLVFDLGRVLSFGLFLPFMLYGLFLSFCPTLLPVNHSPFTIHQFSLLHLFIVVYSLLHIFTWAMSRYRAPVDAVLLLFAALAIWRLSKRIERVS